MHPSTEDLLSVRDGEPVDAAVREAIAGDVAQAREVERLRALRHALRGLPELAPPDGVWERIEVAERETPARSAPWRTYAAGIGIAAVVAAAAVAPLFLVGTRPPLGNGSLILPNDRSVSVANGARGPAVAAPPRVAATASLGPLFGGRVVPTSYPALVQESARLDGMLHRLQYQQPMMSGATASTIAGLEDRIALVDEQLTYSNARGVPQPERTALWGERVELMNALVHVRFAQAQPGGFELTTPLSNENVR
jgi:hypothetical protein